MKLLKNSRMQRKEGGQSRGSCWLGVQEDAASQSSYKSRQFFSPWWRVHNYQRGVLKILSARGSKMSSKGGHEPSGTVNTCLHHNGLGLATRPQQRKPIASPDTDQYCWGQTPHKCAKLVNNQCPPSSFNSSERPICPPPIVPCTELQHLLASHVKVWPRANSTYSSLRTKTNLFSDRSAIVDMDKDDQM